MAQIRSGGAKHGGISMLTAASARGPGSPAPRSGTDPVGAGPRRASRTPSLTAAVARMMDERGRLVQFRRTFHSFQIPMLLVDNQRRYVDANRSARLAFRLSLAQLRRRRIDDLTPRDEWARLAVLWAELLRHGRLSGDYDVLFDDGSELEVCFSAVANALPGQHLIAFAPAGWPDDELGPVEEPHSRRQRPLSSRETEVLTLIAEGMSLSDIAQRLTISLATVRTHATNIYRKLGARNRSHAIALALRRGLIALGDDGRELDADPSSTAPEQSDA